MISTKTKRYAIKASYDWQDRVEDNDDIQLSYMRYFFSAVQQ